MPFAVSQATGRDVPAVWGYFQRQIDRALSHGDGDSTTSDHMLNRLMSGGMQLWVVHEDSELIAALVVSVHVYEAKKTVVIELAAGRDLDRWADHMEKLLIQFKDLVGADTIECSCRAGLAHRLKKRGWKRKAVIMELVNV